jgi:hypothetical protein
MTPGFHIAFTPCVVVAIALVTFSTLVSASDACQKPVGTAFTNTLIPGECLRNGRFDFVMQYDGNLVLYDGARACWSSHTGGNEGVYAQFSGDDKLGSPFLGLESPYGRLGYYQGGYTLLHKTGADVSLNEKGEIWIGWKNVFSC